MGSLISNLRKNINNFIYGKTPKSEIDYFLDEYQIFLNNSKNNKNLHIELIEID